MVGSSVTVGSTGSLHRGSNVLEVTGLQANTGTISVGSGGTLTLDGTWQNPGTVTVASGTLDLGGSFTTAGIGTISLSGSYIENLVGSLNKQRHASSEQQLVHQRRHHHRRYNRSRGFKR